MSNKELNQRQDLLLNTVFMFNGLKRSGKDTCSKLLQEILKEDFGLDFQILAFAQPMKNILSKSFGISLKELEHLKNVEMDISIADKYDLLELNIPLELSNFRKFIEYFGQAVKEEMGQDIWARITWGKVEESIESLGIGCIISDFRFPIEYPDYSDFNIVTIKVNNDNILCSGSVAETSLDDFKFNYHIQNHIKWNNEVDELRVVEDLKEQIRYILADYFYEKDVD